MLKKAIYTWLGAQALTLEFVTHPSRAQLWLDKAERRGSKVAAGGEQRLRRLSKSAERQLEDLRETTMSAVGLAERRTKRTAAKAETSVKKAARTARRRTPRARVSRRTRGTGTRRVTSTTLSVAS